MFSAPMKPVAPPLLLLDHVDTTALHLYPGGLPSPTSMPPTKRPKLTLQTSSLPTSCGTKSSIAANRADGLSAVTPTTLNTFNNTFDLAIRPSPNSATGSPATAPRTKSNLSTPFRRKAPYDLNLPLGVRSILKNANFFDESRRGSLTISASPRSTRRVFFPPVKKVSFVPIDEEIVTQTYVARHLDLSPSEEDSSTNSSQDGDTVAPDAEHGTPLVKQEVDQKAKSMTEQRGRSRRSSWSPSSTQRRRRKRRRWEWTIGDLDKTEGQTLVESHQAEANDDYVSPEASDTAELQKRAAATHDAALPSPHGQPASSEGNNSSEDAALVLATAVAIEASTAPSKEEAQ